MSQKTRTYIFAALEGTGVMSIELLGGKMLAPYYGTSHYIWTIVIAVNLLCLAGGYYSGAMLSKKNKPGYFLQLLFPIAAIGTLLMPFLSDILYQYLISVNIFAGAILLTLILFFLPMMALGATGPLLIQLSSSGEKSAGQTAGTIFALSTTGGILATYIMGFYFIPEFGIRLPLLFISVFILTISIILNKPSIKLIAVFVLILISEILLMFKPLKTNGEINKSQINVLYQTEGLMGQLKVMDYMGASDIMERALQVNNSAQSIIQKSNVTAISNYNYVHLISALTTLQPAGSRVLLFGMAGASLVYEFQQQEHEIDVVDIDERMFEVAKKYFYFQPVNTTMIVDDARHYARICKKKYDVIIIDISSSETQPSYLYTLENFTRIKELLNPNGLFFINFQGQLTGKSGLSVATWSIYKTLLESDFKTYVYSPNKNKKDDVLFISSDKTIDFKKLDSQKINICCAENQFVKNLVTSPLFVDNFALCEIVPLVLNDDKPLLEKLKFEAVVDTRSDLIKAMDENKIKKKQKLFR